ncbi:MAG TPA: hypothetical protein VMG12_22440 [Polyangiaceae bacterium]|nr:hypothetical protein [Polyangiaceae bacterium]
MKKSTSALAWIALLVVGCSSDSGKTAPTPADTAGASDVPTPGTAPGESMDFGDLEPGSEDELAGESCLGETRATEQIGLDLFIMLDTSGSMLDVLPGQAAGGATKWDSVRGALEEFVQSPDTADIGIGLQYFPQIEADVPFSCETNDQCGAFGPCSNSLCVIAVSQDDPNDQNPPLTFLRITDDGPRPCVDSGDCNGPNETCQTIAGECVIPPFLFADVPNGSFLNMNPDPNGPLQSPVCSQQSDCAGLPGTSCDQLGICEDLANFCTPNLACAGGGGCFELPSTCVSQTKCDAGDYSTPAVAISAAPDRSTAIITSLTNQAPNGLTPTGPALEGALTQARAWAQEHPDRQVVTLLVTDGFPTECAPIEIPDIAALAQSAATAPRPVRTFVVGVFSDIDLQGDGQARLNALARAGDTERALIVNTAGDVTRDFLAALDAVRTTSLSCDFALEGSGVLDFGSVNLRVTDASGTQTPLFNVDNFVGCGADGNGWYYVRDAGGTPTQIRVCPGACEELQSGAATAELQIGCATLIR